jgi:hypothetical protein
MSQSYDKDLGTYTRWAEAFSPEGLQKTLKDQATLRRGQLREGDGNRVTPAQPTRRAYDAIRATRDNLDYREWNDDTGFSGVTRWPSGPGMVGHGVETDGQKRRRAHLEQLDDGF